MWLWLLEVSYSCSVISRSALVLASTVKYLWVFLLNLSIWSFGWPSISTMRQSKSYSLAPGKSGRPKKSSAAMHPRDHMSIEKVYGYPRTTSIDLRRTKRLESGDVACGSRV